MATMTQRHRAASILERGDTLMISDSSSWGDVATVAVKPDGANWIREYIRYGRIRTTHSVRCYETKKKAVTAALRQAMRLVYRGMQIRNEVTA